MNYKKDYSAKTADEWFSEKKWTAFLMSLPLGRTRDYTCDNYTEINKIRTIASMLTKRGEDRKFSITTADDAATSYKFYIKADKR